MGASAPVPLTAAQTAMWLAQQMDPTDPGHDMAQYTIVAGALDPAVAKLAWTRLVADTEALRIRVQGSPTAPVVTAPPLPVVDLPVVDVAACSDPIGAALSWMHEELRLPIDLTSQAPFRVALFVLGEQHYCWYFRVHHMAYDGYGSALVIARLSEIYRASAAGENCGDAGFASLEALYREEMAYQRSPRFAADREYWRTKCVGLPPPLILGHSMGEPAADVIASAGEIDARSMSRLRAVAREARSGWPAVAVAAVAGYTHRATGVRDLVLGLTASRRVTDALKRTPCIQADVFPVRLSVRPDMTMAELIRSSSNEIRQSLRHQRYRSEFIRRDLGLAGTTAPWSGIEVNAMPFDHTPNFAGLPAVTHFLRRGPVDGLAVILNETGGGQGLQVDLEGRTGAFTADALHAHRAGLTEYLIEAADDPAQAVGRFGRIRRLTASRIVRHPVETAVDVVSRVRVHARSAPDAPAVVDDGRTLSYAELAERVDALARMMREAGVRRGTQVAVLADRSAELVAGIVAILAAGAAFVPLDPRATDRTAAMLTDCGARWLLTDRAHLATATHLAAATGAGVETLSLEEVIHAGLPLELRGTPDDVAYVMYTSGTTGRPKGAMIARRGMTNHLLAKVELLGLSSRDTVVQNARLTFDISVWQLLAPLLVGGTVRVLDDACSADPSRLFTLVATEHVSILEIVPSLLRAALDAWDDAGGPGVEPRHLRWLIVTGETLPPDLCARWLTWFPRTPIVNAYGPTECSDDVCHAIIDTAPSMESLVSIGTPIQNTTLHVLDAGLRSTPEGTAGELYVAGEGVGLGYLNEPGRTAVSFVANPYSDIPGSRLYRTGDRVRLEPTGDLQFLGRNDRQVKVRGHRIELDEVEAVLRAVPGVRQAVTAAGPGGNGQTALFGFVVGQVQPNAVRAAMRGKLPEAMVPSRLVVLESLPLTANGKTDLAALLAMSRKVPPQYPSRPREPREQLVCDLVADLLGLPSIGTGDDFFALGGNSIDAIKLAAHARRYGLEFAPLDVFQQRTVAGLAAVAKVITGASAEDPAVGIGEIPLSPVGHEVICHGDIAGIHQWIQLESPPELTTEVLVGAIQAILDHHASLRTRLVASPQWHLDVGPIGSVDAQDCLRVIHLPATTDDDLAETADEQRAAAVRRLEPAGRRMLQAVWLCSGTGPGRLLLVAHHLAVDPISWGILATDLVAACRLVAVGEAPALAAVKTSYRTWARRLASMATERTRATELSYWHSVLATPDAPLGERALDPFRDTARTLRTLTVTVPAPQIQVILETVSAAFYMQPEEVLLWAVAVAVAAWRPRSGEREHAVLLEREGDERHLIGGDGDLSRTVGNFTARHPVRIDLRDIDWSDLWAGGPSLGRVLKEVKEQLRAIPDNGMGYGMLRYLSPSTAAELGRSPVPQLGWSYRRLIDPLDGLSGAGWSFMDASRSDEDTNLDRPLRQVLAIDAMVRQARGGPVLTATFSWPAELLSGSEVRDIADGWLGALRAATVHLEMSGAGGHSPSDFAVGDLTQDEIDEFERIGGPPGGWEA